MQRRISSSIERAQFFSFFLCDVQVSPHGVKVENCIDFVKKKKKEKHTAFCLFHQRTRLGSERKSSGECVWRGIHFDFIRFLTEDRGDRVVVAAWLSDCPPAQILCDLVPDVTYPITFSR